MTIYDKNGGVRAEVSVSDSSNQVKEIGGENVLSLSFVSWTCLELDVLDYVDFAGERYWVTERYRPEMRSTMEWSYDLKLYGLESLLGRFLVLDRSGAGTEAEFVLTGPPVEHVRLIVSCLNAGLGVSPDSPDRWLVGEVTGTENVTLEYKGQKCDEALSALAEAVDTEWWTDGRTLNLCRCEVGPELTLAYGRGLTSLSRERGEDERFYTRLYPLGSTKNIDAEIYGHRRLQLPGGAAYVDIPDLVEKYGVVERYEEGAFAGIFPRWVGRVSSVRSEEVQGSDGKPFTIYYFKDDSLTFDPNDFEIARQKKRVSFQEGSELAGLGTGDDHYFEVNFDSDAGEFEIITIWPYDDDTQLPGGGLVPKVGNRYILWNMMMPPAYYDLAEEELAEAVAAYNEAQRRDCSVYRGSTDVLWVEAAESVARQSNETDSRSVVCVGRKVRLESTQYFAEGFRESRITRLTRSVNHPYSVDLEISDVLVRSFRQHVEEGMRDVKTYATSLFGGLSIPDLIRVGDVRKATDSNVFSALRVVVDGDRKFVRKDWADERQEVAGDVTFKKGVTVAGDGGVGGDLFVTGKALVGGDQGVGGALDVSGNAYFEQDTETMGDAEVHKVLSVYNEKSGGEAARPNLLYGDTEFGHYRKDVLLPGASEGVRLTEEGYVLAKGMELSESLTVPELRYNRATAIVGANFMTQGGGVIEEVTVVDATHGACRMRLEEGEAGAVMAGDLCMGMWHNAGVLGSGNASADSDDHRGHIEYKGFTTIYFRIDTVPADDPGLAADGRSGTNGDSHYFTYELRSGFGFHPQPGMHFAAFTNIAKTSQDEYVHPERQSFSVETKDYLVSLRRVTGWTWGADNIYYVRGRLRGFDYLMGDYADGAYFGDETGLVLSNVYFYGAIRNFDRNIRLVQVEQSKGGWLLSHETETVRLRLVDEQGAGKNEEVNEWRVTRSDQPGVEVAVRELGSGDSGYAEFEVSCASLGGNSVTFDVECETTGGLVLRSVLAVRPSPSRGENAVEWEIVATPGVLGLKEDGVTVYSDTGEGVGVQVLLSAYRTDGRSREDVSLSAAYKWRVGLNGVVHTFRDSRVLTWTAGSGGVQTIYLLGSSGEYLAETTVRMVADGKRGNDGTFSIYQLSPTADVIRIDKNGRLNRSGFVCNVTHTTEVGSSTIYRHTNWPQNLAIRYSINRRSSVMADETAYVDAEGIHEDGSLVKTSGTDRGVFIAEAIRGVAAQEGGTNLYLYLWHKIGDTWVLTDERTVSFVADGTDGASVSVSSNSTEYAASTQGTTAPASGWQDSVPSVAQGHFLWTRVTTCFSDGTSVTSYGVSYQGKSVEIDSASTWVRYSTVKTASQPADNTFTRTTPPSLSPGDYLWSLSQTKYVGVATPLKSYSVSRIGTDGEDGAPGTDGYTTHFAYARLKAGQTIPPTGKISTSMVDRWARSNFEGSDCFGTYSDQSVADSDDISSYTWTMFKGDDAVSPRANLMTGGERERVVLVGSSPSYAENGYTVYYGWKHLEIAHVAGRRVVVSMKVRYNGLANSGSGTLRLRVLMFGPSGNACIFYKELAGGAQAVERLEFASLPDSADYPTGRYQCRVELVAATAGVLFYSEVKAEEVDAGETDYAATPYFKNEDSNINPNLLSFTRDGKDKEGHGMWNQYVVNGGVFTMGEDDFRLNNPVTFDSSNTSNIQSGIRDEGIVRIPANQTAVVSFDAWFEGTEPYRWVMMLHELDTDAYVSWTYYGRGVNDTWLSKTAGYHLLTTPSRFFCYLEAAPRERTLKVLFKHDGANGSAAVSALHVRRVKVETGMTPTPWVISEDDKTGASGLPGKDAVPVVFAGEWDASAIYYYDDVRREVVVRNGHYYVVKTQGTACTPADIPGESSEKWQAFGGEFRSVATDVLIASDVLSGRGWFDHMKAEHIEVKDSDLQDVVIRGVLSKMVTTIPMSEFYTAEGDIQPIENRKYTGLANSTFGFLSTQRIQYLNVWRCGDVVEVQTAIVGGNNVVYLMLPAAWYSDYYNENYCYMCPGRGGTMYDFGFYTPTGGIQHGFRMEAGSDVLTRSFDDAERPFTFDDMRRLVGRKMVFRNTGTGTLYVCAPRYRYVGGDIVEFPPEIITSLRLSPGETRQAECVYDTDQHDKAAGFDREGYHWEFEGVSVKMLDSH